MVNNASRKKRYKNVRQNWECRKCGWEWFSRLEKPIVCPKCHSPYWERETDNDSNS